ncbi:hypothetical protein PBY51_001587 [Eleginops maclovinus]|uniref:Uncharacterized protein n=1 Tax=Eleginops maclovinus TaxID=56733 RepID=A0AAN7X0Q8_ELEMC|nr:hypothetical protein PBY51_001587 [Eleginops maclovinus]
MTSKTRGPVDIEEDSGNPFEGFRGKMDMRSRWVSVKGICWQLAASWLPESLDPWLHPMQLSPITSSQQAHCDDAIPLEARSGYPG